MRTFATTIILLTSLILQGQKIDDHYIVKSTRDTIVTTKWTKVEKTDFFLLSFRLTRHNSAYALELKFNFGDGPVFKVNKGDSIMIKFKSGWGFSLYAKDTVKSKKALSSYPGSMSGLTVQGVYVNYPMAIGQILSLRMEKIEKVRIYSSRGFDNYILKDGEPELFVNAATSITTPIVIWDEEDQLKTEKKEEYMDGQKDEEW